MVLASRQLAYLQDMSARETAFAVSRQRQSETREAEAARQAASGLVSELGAAWDTDVKCQLGAYLAARLVRHAHFEPGRRGGEAAWEGPGGELQPLGGEVPAGAGEGEAAEAHREWEAGEEAPLQIDAVMRAACAAPPAAPPEGGAAACGLAKAFAHHVARGHEGGVKARGYIRMHAALPPLLLGDPSAVRRLVLPEQSPMVRPPPRSVSRGRSGVSSTAWSV